MTDKENKELSRLIAKGIKKFPAVLARKKRAYEEKKKRMKAFMPMAKALQKQLIESENVAPPIHPWRLCPYGQHFRKKHQQGKYTRKSGVKVRGSAHPIECVINPSGKDQLYVEEIQEIATRHFSSLTNLPKAGVLSEYANESHFDPIIAGWTKYWNEVLKPAESLDPDLVKSLIATESGFNPAAWNKKRGLKRARGLMQVTDGSLILLSYKKKELKDQFVNLKEDDMLDPNLSVCAGIRWLFRKREILNNRKKTTNWIETILLYKSYKSIKDPQMQKLLNIYKTLKG